MLTSTAPSGMRRMILEALGRFTTARLRQMGIASVYPGWELRAAVCEQCPMRVIQCGVSYCGKPYFRQVDRDPALDGCGCPCRDKAKRPLEHCPLGVSNQPARRDGGRCSCKWCRKATP